ncbi:GNAT family N-acetyltransferase [Amycolatopsis sp. YIM 10]|uniref:GNAT family N-acetyltransferase n=1 Tax=Amycolatopsis sp. YIM 10 TaxID=2653857 RepID=UPI00129043CF|nr:GNAT family N-acetyltransferase [Amycolatopsis sp. YIM 10]QFU94588.1 Enhanced intracellular survival protein [Amycolatopsis sp. YIM 10]
MTDFTVRHPEEHERRPTQNMVARALHYRPFTDEQWAFGEHLLSAERTFGAYEDGLPIGMTSSAAVDLAVPGGQVPAAAVAWVGVRADRTRRGVVSELLTTQLRDCRERGEPVAALHASEATIYGRFGYGVSCQAKYVVVDRTRARMRADVPSTGSVRLLSDAEAPTVPREIYRAIDLHRPGMITRDEPWWRWGHDRVLERDGRLVAVHRDHHGVDDGFAVYRPVSLGTFEQPVAGGALDVVDLHAANPGALAGLWRFLLSIDLVAKIRVKSRPVDEPIDLMLEDPRAATVTGLHDHLWIRLADVPQALASRTYAHAEPVVLEVRDPRLPENEGRYRIGPDGVERTSADAGLTLDVDTLGMLYLGGWPASALAGIGRVHAVDPSALTRADALFSWARPPWCGTDF